MNLPFDKPGRFWRGNLHTHSNRSDGGLPPEAVCRIYQDAGYHFLAVTDHFREKYGYPVTDTRALRAREFTTLTGAELHGPRTEFSREWHIIAAGLPLGFAPPGDGETGPELARRARAAGASIGMAHPAASLLTPHDADSLDAAHAVEAYNFRGAREDRADSWHLTDLLLGAGRRLTAYAADDAHFKTRDSPGCKAWVQVRAESLDPGGLLAALKAGHYYSSTGPGLHAVELGDGKITVRCTAAERVLVTGAIAGRQACDGPGLTECELSLDRFTGSPYVRVTVADATGGRAWTNPIWLR